jgi:RNA recognition motif-containing protein
VEPRAVVEKKEEDELEPEKKKTKKQFVVDPEAEKERLERTIFVGGVPVTNKTDKIEKHFSKYGKIESVWFRSVAFSKMANPK